MRNFEKERKQYLDGEITLDELLLEVYNSGYGDGFNDSCAVLPDSDWEAI